MALVPQSYSLRILYSFRDLVFRNDLIWSNSFPHPRWGQGAFRTTLEALYTSLTEDPEPLNITQFGKPSTATFTYAENVLMDYLSKWHGATREPLVGGLPLAPRRVYMFGDNPESGITQRKEVNVDIRGANEFGWYSVLVRTGNFKGEGNSDKFPAKRVFDDVEKAVKWILRHEERRYQNLVKALGSGGEVDAHDERFYEE